jgi:hypothetical protein
MAASFTLGKTFKIPACNMPIFPKPTTAILSLSKPNTSQKAFPHNKIFKKSTQAALHATA